MALEFTGMIPTGEVEKIPSIKESANSASYFIFLRYFNFSSRNSVREADSWGILFLLDANMSSKNLV